MIRQFAGAKAVGPKSRWRTREHLCAVVFIGLVVVAGCGPNRGSAPNLQDLRDAESTAKEAIKAKQGTVEAKEYPPGPGHAVTLKNAEISDDDIEHLHAIEGLAELDLSGSTITDQQLRQLVTPPVEEGGLGVPFLFKLNLSNTPITDDGLRELRVLKFLTEINVQGSQVTEAGIQELEVWRTDKKLPYGMKFKLVK